jgi:uncharacterized protein (TIGR03437 family)
VDPKTPSTVNISVRARTGFVAYNLSTYSKIDSASRTYVYTGDQTVTPAYINTSQNSTNQAIIVQTSAPTLTPPQSVTILGGFAPALLSNTAPPQVLSYNDPNTGVPSLAVYFLLPIGAGTGPRHLVFNYGNDIYVLPNAINLVDTAPPVISSTTSNPNGTVTINGAGLSGTATSVYFAGVKANPGTFTGNVTQGSLIVTPPPGASGQTAVLSVANPDGQNSMFLQSANPPVYTYPVTPGVPAITNVSQTALPAGISAYVQIDAANTNFVDGQVTVGFGSRDVTVRRVWVINPTRLWADVTVASSATIGFSEVSVVNGLQVVSQPGGFQTIAARPDLPNIGYPVVNAEYPVQQTIWPGSYASIFGVNLGASANTIQVTLNDRPVVVQAVVVNPGQVNILIPSDFPIGPAILKLNNGSQNAYALVVQIDPPPPVVIGMLNASGAPLGSTAVTRGDQVTAVVTGLDPSITPPSRVKVLIGGFEMGLGTISAYTISGQTQVSFVVNRSFDPGTQPLTIQVDGSSGASWPISVH